MSKNVQKMSIYIFSWPLQECFILLAWIAPDLDLLSKIGAKRLGM